MTECRCKLDLWLANRSIARRDKRMAREAYQSEAFELLTIAQQRRRDMEAASEKPPLAEQQAVYMAERHCWREYRRSLGWWTSLWFPVGFGFAGAAGVYLVVSS